MNATLGFGLATATAGWLIAQAPTPTTPPSTLPPAITGQTQPPGAITPVTAPSPSTQKAPIDQFSAQQYPSETMQCVYGIRTGADWLGRVHQANGRCLPGINPTLAAVWANDSDAKQAMALLGLCQIARVTGDASLSAKASQSLLTVMSNLKPDATDPAKLTVACLASERTTVAACLILATAEMPNADARTLAVAEHMTLFLRSATETDPLARSLSMRALATSHRQKPADWKRDAAMSAITSAATELKTKFQAVLASGVVTAATDLYLVTKDARLATMANEWADMLCAKQYDRAKVQGGFTWAGAVKVNDGDEMEPNFEQAAIATGLIAAAQLARQSADLVRYTKYRQAAVDSLMFIRGLQMTPETASHFESGFRTRSVVGGVRSAVTDSILRSDATAMAIIAYVRFVESGCENQ